MPWQEYQAVEQRMMFIAEHESSGGSFTALCARYEISRMTGYKWLDRFEVEGLRGLWERSRAPHRVGHALSQKLVGLILEAQEAHPSWGPRKLLARLKVTHSRVQWCVSSTVGELLRRQGLVKPRVYRRGSAPRWETLEPYTHANRVWCTDFKGWFILGNGQRCEPWTLTDGWSRYLLGIKAMKHQKSEEVRQSFERVFREHGLPDIIRSDNGRPFAGIGFGGLSQLSVWWIKLGIRPERIRPGKPQENGRHERMHLTLLDACEPPEKTFPGQQRRFDEFRQEFNEERPHEALEDQTPAQWYQSSSRHYPKRIPRVEYETGVLTKRVHQHGDITWQGERLFLNEALAGEEVAIEPFREGWWQIRFGPIRVAKLDERKRCLMELTAEDLALGGRS